MELPDPDERVKAAVNGAMEWLDLHKLYGIRVERFMTPEGKRDTHVVKDEKAGPVWARFYDLENEEPLFCDRDGVPRKSFSELGYERRNGYSWYNQAPESLNEEYQYWKEKYM